MEDFKNKLKKTKNNVKEKIFNSYRSFKLKYQTTKAYKNIDSLIKFQTIHYEIINKYLFSNNLF